MLLKGTIQSSDINTFQHVEFQRMEEAMAEFEEISFLRSRYHNLVTSVQFFMNEVRLLVALKFMTRISSLP